MSGLKFQITKKQVGFSTIQFLSYNKIFRGKTIKNFNVFQYFWIVLILISSLFLWFLYGEYKFFKLQSQQLIELQEDYRNYINVLRKVFDSQKADNQEVESIIEEKKKPFIVINREKRYLKQSFLDFLKKKRIKTNSAFLNNFSENQILNESSPSQTQKPINKKNSKQIIKSNFKRKLSSLFNKEVSGVFNWPINQNEFWISSFFGLRKVRKGYSFHYGIDMAAIKGTIVRASNSGQVITASYSSGYGNTIVIKHDSKYKTRYAHLNNIEAKVGQNIEKGQRIGTVGDTGSVRSYGKSRDASHLHFEVYAFDKQINPLYVLQ